MTLNTENEVEMVTENQRNTNNKKGNPDHSENRTIDYDALLLSAGGFGRYQLVLFIFTFPFYVFAGFGYFSQLFVTQASPNHWCWIPELANLSALERRNIGVPYHDKYKFGYSRCLTYDVNWTDVLVNGLSPNDTWRTKSCEHGWEFNVTEIPYPTISSEMGWVCERDSYPVTAQSLFFAGAVIGGVLFGWIADKFGRLPALVLSNVMACAGGVASTFVSNFIQFTICRFIVGMANDSVITMAYLIVIEYVAPKYRAFVANLPFALVYAPVLVALPWIALVCANWKTFNLVTSVPIGVAILSPFFIPESPRWLLSKGHIEEVSAKILVIAKTNNNNVDMTDIEKFKMYSKTQNINESASVFDLFKRPLLRKTYICICLVYGCSVLVFDALVRTIEQLKFNFFISFSIISATELPSLLISALTLDKLGRRCMIAITMGTCCVFSILTAFSGGGIPSVVFALVARFVTNMSFGAVGQWTAEILPTCVRGTANSLVHILGYVMIMISPYIAYLGKYVHWLPLFLTGLIAGVCAILAQTLPETAGIDLPQTLEDTENLIRTQKSFRCPCLKNKHNDNFGQDNYGFDK